jgi:hypothetical protein
MEGEDLSTSKIGGQGDNLKKMFYVEMRNPNIHKDFGGSNEPYSKVIDIKCQRFEQSLS